MPVCLITGKITKVVPQARKKGYPGLPVEIKIMILAEEIKEHSLHYFKVQKCEDEDRCWRIELRHLPQRQDASSYRRWNELALVDRDSSETVSLALGPAVSALKLWTNRKLRSRRRLRVRLRSQTDLVVLDFERGTEAPGYTWDGHTPMLHNRPMRILTIRENFEPIQLLGLPYMQRFEDCSHIRNPFCCRPFMHGPLHANLKLCPMKVAHFLDCFPNLDAVYFIIKPTGEEGQAARHYRSKVRPHEFQYKAIRGLFTLEQAQAQAQFLERDEQLDVFHNIKKPLVEMPPSVIREKGWDMPLAYDALAAAELSREALLLGADLHYHSERKLRENVKFKILLDC